MELRLFYFGGVVESAGGFELDGGVEFAGGAESGAF
jgi:hypothetical protein